MSAHFNLMTTHGRRVAAGLALVLLLSAGAPAHAEESTLPEDAERLAGEGLGKILQALNLLMQTIPEYAAPEVQPNGDIIIRRVHPDETLPTRPEDEEDEPSDGTET